MSIITPFLAVLLALAFPFRGTIRYDGGAVIPGLEQQTVDFRLYRSVDDASALWGRRCTVHVQTNGLFVVEVSDSMGTEIPPGTGVETEYSTLETALLSVGSAPLYAGYTIKGRSVEIRPRTRIMPLPSVILALDTDQAAAKFVLTNSLTVTKGVAVAGACRVNGTLDAFQIAGTGTVDFGGDLAVSNAVVGSAGLAVRGAATLNGGLTAHGISAANVSAVTAAVMSVTAETAAFDALPSWSATTPKGMIVMWYGDAAKIPKDWALCDGSKTADGYQTPDLRGLFIVGASRNPSIEKKTYTVGDKGGSDVVKLSVENLPSHSHAYSDYLMTYSGYKLYDGKEFFTYEEKTKLDASTRTTGGTAAHPNLPSYCAVYYLIKVK